MNFAARVRALFERARVVGGSALIDENNQRYVRVKGVAHDFAFVRDRLDGIRSDYIALCVEMLPDLFYQSKGGGWTFLDLPFDRNEERWGEQRDAEVFLAIGLALDIAKYSLGREFWSALPGGVPYVVFDL